MEKCTECAKTYKTYDALRKHVKIFHKEKVNLIAPLKSALRNYNYVCHCGKNFNHKRNFNMHLRTHGERGFENHWKNKKQCPLCAFEDMSRDLLHEHFRATHSIHIRINNLEFLTFDDFEAWKSDKEKVLKCRFVKERGQSKHKSFTKIIYICHRSGVFVSESKGAKHSKLQTTNKINAFCPAQMKVYLYENGKCKVQYTETHVGHTNDLGHIFLTSTQLESVAVNLESDIQFERVLDGIRDSIAIDLSDKTHILTKNDLYNIEAAYNVHAKSLRHKTNSVDAWVKELMQGKESCILFYKPQAVTLANHPELRDSDFILCIMNNYQAEILKKFGEDCICIDRTHDTNNNYNFELHTLIVLDDLKEAHPCGFLISNRSDTVVIKLFIQAVKEKIKTKLKPKIFMSDMAQVYYNEWIKVMEGAEHRLFCCWHVDRAWRENLNLISTKEKQVEVYKALRTLLQETDRVAFNTKLEELIINTANDSEIAKFATYFKENYVSNVASWAYCFRKHSVLNTIERTHRIIEYVYMGGEDEKRLDEAMNCIMKFNRDKVLERHSTSLKGELIANIRSCHKRSVLFGVSGIYKSGEGWQIPSASDSYDNYYVQKSSSMCECQLTCDECKVCIHHYYCTCIDSTMKWNMCQHVHLLRRFLSPQCQESFPHTDDDHTTSHMKCNPSDTELEILEEPLYNSTADEESLDIEKEKLQERFQTILNNIHTKGQMEFLIKSVAAIESTLATVDVETNFTLKTEDFIKQEDDTAEIYEETFTWEPDKVE